MSWHGQLDLDYTRDGERTIALDRHEGPLRVLQRLYPEGDAICHHVLVHPPGGIAGGDVLQMNARLARGTHALITTPGATRFYKSAGAQAEQRLLAQVADDARLEWLPLETIAYPGCIALNAMRFELAARAQMMGWDFLALGLPAARQPFDAPEWAQGRFAQHIEVPGVWLEKGTVAATDHLLLDSPLASTAGATSPDGRLVLVRALAARVEPLVQLFTAIRAHWRQTCWQLPGETPRIWRM